ncbi:MAG: M16 family metallopeptidase [Anaerolineae bacterium]
MSTTSSSGSHPHAPIGPHTIHRATLTNGIRVVVQENHTSPSVVIRGYLWAGSISDPPERAGLADFTAAAVRRGSLTRTYQEINDQIESVGASVFFDAGRRLTHFGGKSLAEDLTILVDVLADLLLHPAFPPQEIEKLRGQALTRLKELEDDTRHLAEREFRQLLYPDHPYGRPVEGTLESISLIQRNDVFTFYQGHYGPGGTVIVVGGDVVAEAVFELLEKHLGSWRADAAHAATEMPPVHTPQDARRSVRTLTNKTQVDIVLGTVGLPRTAPDFYAARVADTILGHMGLMGRLGDRVRDQLGLAYYVHSSLEAGLGPGPWSVSAGVAPEHVEQAITAIRAEITRMRDEMVSQQEMEDAQDYLTGTLPLRLETNEGITATLLDMELYNLGDDYIIRYPSIIRAVTREEVQAVMRKYLDVERFVLAMAGPYQE